MQETGLTSSGHRVCQRSAVCEKRDDIDGAQCSYDRSLANIMERFRIAAATTRRYRTERRRRELIPTVSHHG